MPSVASLSLDLDNKWSYLKTHGNEQWRNFPSYLDTVVPRTLAILERLQLQITFFIVGQDAVLPYNAAALGKIVSSGHEVGNHSFHHEPWLHRYSPEQLREEIGSAQTAIYSVTGQLPVGFRGPGYSFSRDTLEVLVEHGMRYDASTLPTYIGPLARTYYFWTSRLDDAQREDREMLFGTMKDGLRPLKPYRWQLSNTTLLELPVTTIPMIKAPFHVSYLLFLRGYSAWLAATYFRFALTMCRLRGVRPSLLLHPLDFIGADDDADLRFFPAMQLSSEQKCQFVERMLATFRNRFQVVTMSRHAEIESANPRLPIREVDR